MIILSFSDKFIFEYQKDANKKLSFSCRVTMLLLVIVVLLNCFHVFKLSSVLYPVIAVSFVVMFIPTIIYDILKKDSKFFRYLVVTLVVLMSGLMYSFLSYHVIIMLVYPVVLSMIYCDKKMVIYSSILGLPVMVISHLVAFNLKIIPDEPLVTLKGVIFYGVLPRAIEYIVISVVCISIAGKLQKLISELETKNDELYKEQENIITTLSTMIESESKETGGHVKRVSEYTAILCRAMEMDDEEVWKVSLAAMMHDVGKILIPHDILEKPGRLTDEEYEIIKKHTVYGKRMLENSSGEIMQISARIAFEHHERYDGKGYAGMKGEEIHIYSRCVSIADVFDALVSWRPYKKPWTLDEARVEIVGQGGKQFDPVLVKAFDEHFDEFIKVFEKYPDSIHSVETDAIYK